MKYFSHIWYAPSVDAERADLYKKLKKHKLPETVSVVVLPKDGHKLLEIYDGDTIAEKYYRRMDAMVIGIAGGRDEAVELAGGIIARAIHETGSPDVRAYIAKALREARDA